MESELEVILDAEESNLDGFHEECGVFGVYGHPEAANLAYLGLYGLQHRGQESAGIVSSNGKSLIAHRGMGLVADIFNEDVLRKLEGTTAIGHNRYSTTGSTTIKNCQPLVVEYARGGIAVAHNGNLVNFNELRERLEASGSIFQSSSDSEVIVHLIAASHAPTVVERVIEALSQVKGAYSLAVLTEHELIAVRDPQGFRPLVLGNLNGAPIITSETCALDLVRAEYVREIDPGEVVIINEDGIRSLKPFALAPTKRCIFEYVYFARPDSLLYGRNVYSVRKQQGRALARQCPAKADLVVPVPDSGNAAALGYAEESGLPFEMALVRSHYIGQDLHRAAPVDSPLRREDQVQSGGGVAARQAHRADRGFSGARHHAAQGHPDAAAGGRARGPHAHRGAADHQLMLLWHRHADARRAPRVESFGRGDPPLHHRRLARVPELGRALLVPGRARGLLRCVLHRQVSDRDTVGEGRASVASVRR